MSHKFGINPVTFLGQIGFEILRGAPSPLDEELADADYARAMAEAGARDSRHVGDILRSEPPKPAPFGDGMLWLGRTITWPDRVPGLVTWSGQQTLAKITRTRQAALGDSPIDDILSFASPVTGVTGLDPVTSRDPVDIGYSPNALGMAVEQRVGCELLAIIGLESLPLVSFARRVCGLIHHGVVWRFVVSARAGGYYHRWGLMETVE